MDNLSVAHECNRSLALAQSLLRSGCNDLKASTGLSLDPDYLARALHSPELSAEVCSSIESACKAIEDKSLLALAKSAVDAISTASEALRFALANVADMQGQRTRAISAYNDNL